MPDVDSNRVSLNKSDSNLDTATIIDNLYEQSIIDFVSNEPVRKVVHVSDLTQDCMRKAWYRLNDYAGDLKDFKKSLPLAHGTALHNIINLGGLEHELSMFCHISTMTPRTNSDGTDIYSCVKGSMDDLIEIDDELIICDKKTTKKSIPREVPEQYKKQMNIYKLLYFITSGIEVKRAAIVYIDKSTAWERHATRVFDLEPIENIKEYVLDKLSILNTKTPPPRVKTFLCPWCDYYLTCKP